MRLHSGWIATYIFSNSLMEIKIEIEYIQFYSTLLALPALAALHSLVPVVQ